jgi:hypothetical protein
MDIRAKVESTSGQGGEMVVHGSSRWRNAASSLAGVRECDSSSPSIFSHCSLPTVRRLHSFISTSAGRVLSRYLLSVTPVTVVCASLSHHRHWPAQGLNKDAEPTPQSARLPSLRQGYPPSTTLHDTTTTSSRA